MTSSWVYTLFVLPGLRPNRQDMKIVRNEVGLEVTDFSNEM